MQFLLHKFHAAAFNLLLKCCKIIALITCSTHFAERIQSRVKVIHTNVKNLGEMISFELWQLSCAGYDMTSAWFQYWKMLSEGSFGKCWMKIRAAVRFRQLGRTFYLFQWTSWKSTTSEYEEQLKYVRCYSQRHNTWREFNQLRDSRVKKTHSCEYLRLAYNISLLDARLEIRRTKNVEASNNERFDSAFTRRDPKGFADGTFHERLLSRINIQVVRIAKRILPWFSR